MQSKNGGRQYPTTGSDGNINGRIDILTKEPEKNQHIVQGNEKVKGTIICREVDERLKLAIQPVKEIIEFRTYKIDFKLSNP